MAEYKIICGNCVQYLMSQIDGFVWDTVFADPPDGIGTKYRHFDDSIIEEDYVEKLEEWLSWFTQMARNTWLSFNSKWLFDIGRIVRALEQEDDLQAKLCIQTFAFGQYNSRDLANNYRPLLRLRYHQAAMFPEAIKVPSWRGLNKDKRAKEGGRVPGDVWDFPRVTGNSKQRRKWHPTQLHEGLVERCLRLTTPPGGTVLDPFGGTGTTLRVCKRLGLSCTLIEIDPYYCEKIAEEHGLDVQTV